MSFGFPAYHQQTETFSLGSGDLNSLVKSAFAELNWSITQDLPSLVEASTSINLSSWGEKVSVSIAGTTAAVVSKCALPTQCVDWGKNKKNVMMLLRKLRELEHFANAQIAPASAGDGISPLTRLITEKDE